MKPTILVVDDEPGVRAALTGYCATRDTQSTLSPAERLSCSGNPRGRRPHRPRRLVARHGWSRDLGSAAGTAGRCSGRAHLGPRQHRIGGSRDQDGGIRLRRKAAVVGQDGPGGAKRAAPAETRGGESGAEGACRPDAADGGRERNHATACASKSRSPRQPTVES